MFSELKDVFHRPDAFECYTAKELWTDAYTAEQMLKFHLNPDVDLSSRNHEFIERSVKWMVSNFSINRETRIADFGCGPGLYTNRLAKFSDHVTGIDFSSNSVAYARDQAAANGLRLEYVEADYLEYSPVEDFDLIIMIMCDFCALSPDQRKGLLEKFFSMLRNGGNVLLDVYSMAAFDSREESQSCSKNLLNGFWAEQDYFGILNVFKYDTEKVILDKYTIVEPDRTRTFYNWLQYFSPADLLEEFRVAGFSEKTLFADVSGSPFDEGGHEFAIVARKD